jgi:succinyl-CoA synthetase alpha subunit
LDGKLYKAHQLAWLYTHGVFAKELDHINQIRNDNRINNLRMASRSMQMHNAGMLKNNTSGAKGVSYHTASKKWHARIWVDGKCRSVGYFDTVEEAQKERNAVHDLLC